VHLRDPVRPRGAGGTDPEAAAVTAVAAAGGATMKRGRTTATVVGLLLAGALLAGATEARAQAALKIGFLAPLSGPFAQTGKDMVAGTEVYLDEIGRQVGGRRIEL